VIRFASERKFVEEEKKKRNNEKKIEKGEMSGQENSRGGRVRGTLEVRKKGNPSSSGPSLLDGE